MVGIRQRVEHVNLETFQQAGPEPVDSEAVDNPGAQPDPREQRGDDFLESERDRDGQQGRKDREPGGGGWRFRLRRGDRGVRKK